MRIVLLVSGNLGLVCLEHIFKNKSISIAAILTDKKSDSIINFAKNNNIPCFAGNPRDGKGFAFLQGFARPEVLLSVNYLFIIEKDLIALPEKYAVNIHGSLLPKYRGRTPHVWSIINGEKETGITAHLITEKCDEGQIVLQKRIPICNDDTGGSILKKYNEVYPQIIDELFEKIENNNLQAQNQNETKATYFPKRTPDEGEINWNWQKERIYNWVRAMAPPEYPGAFTYIDGKKIIVSHVEYSDCGFDALEENGSVKEKGSDFYIIKTPNGCVKATIQNYRWGGGYNLTPFIRHSYLKTTARAAAGGSYER